MDKQGVCTLGHSIADLITDPLREGLPVVPVALS